MYHVVPQIHPPEGPRSARFEGADYQAGVSFFLVDTEPGGGPALHRHPYAETWIVLAGRGVFTADEEDTEAGPGDVVVVEAGTSHKFHNPGPQRLELVCIHAAEKMVTEWL